MRLKTLSMSPRKATEREDCIADILCFISVPLVIRLKNS